MFLLIASLLFKNNISSLQSQSLGSWNVIIYRADTVFPQSEGSMHRRQFLFSLVHSEAKSTSVRKYTFHICKMNHRVSFSRYHSFIYSIFQYIRLSQTSQWQKNLCGMGRFHMHNQYEWAFRGNFIFFTNLLFLSPLADWLKLPGKKCVSFWFMICGIPSSLARKTELNWEAFRKTMLDYDLWWVECSLNMLETPSSQKISRWLLHVSSMFGKDLWGLSYNPPKRCPQKSAFRGNNWDRSEQNKPCASQRL